MAAVVSVGATFRKAFGKKSFLGTVTAISEADKDGDEDLYLIKCKYAYQPCSAIPPLSSPRPSPSLLAA